MKSNILLEVTERRGKSDGPKPKSVMITMELGVVHYAFLKVLASQWLLDFPSVLELFVERIFPREFIKFKTIVYTLLRHEMGITDIVTYLIAGERNEKRIIWLHKQQQQSSTGNDRGAEETGSRVESQGQEEAGGEQAEGKSGI